MWKKRRGSLLARIFAITCGLMMLSSAATWAAIAYLTPITYTAMLEDEQKVETQALKKQLGSIAPGEAQPLLAEFVRKTGACLRLTMESGEVIYDNIPAVYNSVLVEGAATTWEGEEADVIYSFTEKNDAFSGEYSFAGGNEAILNEMVVGDSLQLPVIGTAAETSEVMTINGYDVRFADGSRAMLTVEGGMRAVNQATEAMKKLLPWLMLGMAGVSLLGALVYSCAVTRPMIWVSRLAQRLAGLDFDARWTGKRRDEIGLLGESLNALSDNLSDKLQKLNAANEALAADIEKEKKMEKQRLAFFAAASHELKTPVTILKGQLSGMLAQVGVYRDREKYLARSLEVTGRMENLIREILLISRLESGGAQMAMEQVDMSALADAQLQLDREVMEARGLLVEQSISPGVILHGNKGLLQNAIDNVYMNAALYSPPGARVRVALAENALTVENTGVHLPEEALPQLFTPFFRVEASRSRRLGGSGLGLYVVRCILSLHNVSCAMENTEEGVRFTAQFPQMDKARGVEE